MMAAPDLCRSISSTGSRKSETAGNQCQICLSSFDIVDVSTLPCDHIFCHNCLVKLFLQRDFTCPTCRKELDPESFSDRSLMEFCRRSHMGAMCFRCEHSVPVKAATWCAECAAVFCQKCAGTDSDPDSVSKAGSRHLLEHKMTGFSLKFGAQLYLQLSQLMLQQVDLAAAEEPARIAKISTMFSKKLVAHVTERLATEIKTNYFNQGAAELQQAVFLYSLGFRAAVGSDVKLIQLLHDARLNGVDSDVDFSGTDWSKIMKSGEKLNKLIKCIFNFELTKKDPNALKAMLWNKNPNYFDSSALANRLNSLTTADYRKFAENLVELTSIKAPSYSMLIYDNVLTRKGLTEPESSENGTEGTQNGTPESTASGLSVDIKEESGFSKFKHFLFGGNKRRSTPQSSPGKKDHSATPKRKADKVRSDSPVASGAGARTSQSAGNLARASGVTHSNGPQGEQTEQRQNLINEDGESLQFMGEPLGCEGKRLGICEPTVLPDGRILVCNTVGGIYIFDKDLNLSGLSRISEIYRDVKFDEKGSQLLYGLEQLKDDGVLLTILNLDFEEEKKVALPLPQMEGVRCLAISEEDLFFLESRKLFRVSRKLLEEAGRTKLDMEEVTVLVEQTGEDIEFCTFFFHHGKLYVSSKIQDEILLFDSQSGKIVKRIHSKIFNRPIGPAGICKDEFGNIIVKDLGGLVVLDLETGAFKGLICEQELNTNMSGELMARGGWVYQTSHQGLLIRWQYCRPEMAADKVDREFYKGEVEPERKTKL